MSRQRWREAGSSNQVFFNTLMEPRLTSSGQPRLASDKERLIVMRHTSLASCLVFLALLLVGAALAVPAQAELPPGSYSGSCQDCTESGTIMTCQCRNGEGNYVRTSLNHATCINVENRNGILQCAGTYVRTCHNCQIAGDNLCCDCQAISGDWRSTCMDFAQCRGPITNCDGYLYCGRCP